MKLIRFASVVAFIGGCGSGGSGGTTGGATQSLDCAWLAGDNCYKDVVVAAESCLPSALPPGVLSTNGTTCAFDGGDLVTFISPFVFPIPTMLTFDFSVTLPDGGLCLAYQDLSQGFMLQTAAGTVTESAAGGISITCPGGTVYSNDNPLSLLNCNGGQSLGGLPGNIASYSPDTGDAGTAPASVTFGLLNATDGGSVQVFDCSTL